MSKLRTEGFIQPFQKTLNESILDGKKTEF